MAEHAHRDRVLDLVYGEIEGAEARALRRELEACPSCAPELQKMEDAKRLADALPLAPLPSTTRASILAAARLKANETAAALPARDREVVTREVVAAPIDLWERVRRFLLGPQTAMAAVMLLVVAIGVWYLPGSPESPLGASTMRPEPDLPVEPEPEPEAVAVAEVADSTETPPAVDPAPVVPPQTDVRRRRSTSSARSTSTSTGSVAQRLADPRNAGPLAGVESARDDADGFGLVGRGGRAAEAERELEGAGQAYAAQAPTPPPEPAVLREPSQEAPTDLEVASASIAPNASELAPQALHRNARSRATNGDCAGAVRMYTDLFTRYPAYSDLPSALIEAGRCQRTLGNLSQARTLLVRAEGYTSTRAEAQRELRRLSTVQAASRRSRSMPSSPASLDNAY